MHNLTSNTPTYKINTRKPILCSDGVYIPFNGNINHNNLDAKFKLTLERCNGALLGNGIMICYKSSYDSRGSGFVKPNCLLNGDSSYIAGSSILTEYIDFNNGFFKEAPKSKINKDEACDVYFQFPQGLEIRTKSSCVEIAKECSASLNIDFITPEIHSRLAMRKHELDTPLEAPQKSNSNNKGCSIS